MRRRSRRDLEMRGVRLPSAAAGAFAIGALAVGALALGRLAIGRLSVRRAENGKARLGTVEIDDPTVRSFRILERENATPDDH